MKPSKQVSEQGPLRARRAGDDREPAEWRRKVRQYRPNGGKQGFLETSGIDVLRIAASLAGTTRLGAR